MNKPQVVQLVTALKGCPLSCFFAFILLRSTLSPKELVFITSYSTKTVREALHKLKELGLVTTTGNERWMLTDAGYQLPLGTNELPAGAGDVPKEVKILPISPCSSSSYIDSIDSHDKEPLLLPEKREKITSFLVDLLVSRCACPRKLASKTINEALALADLKGQDIELVNLYLQHEILCWLAWYLSPHGKSIEHLGHFIAAKIANLETAPDWFEPEPGDLYQEIAAIERQISQKEQSHEHS